MKMFIKRIAFIVIINFVSAQKEIITEDNVNYKFFPVKDRTSVSFKVDAHNDAHVALSKHPQFSVPMYELVIGGWRNTKSAIRSVTCLRIEKDEARIPQLVNEQKYRGFWIRWDNGNILVGREEEEKPFMSWQDPKPFVVKYAGVRTTWGSDGNWKLANGTRNNGGNEQTIDVATKVDAKAQYVPVSGSAVHFKVRARNDAKIELTTEPRQTDPMYEIVIGGWSNTKSEIRKYVCNILEKDERQTPQILNAQEFREFWLRWDHGNILVGREGEPQPFLSWQDPDPVRVAYVGVRTTWGGTGIWKLSSGSNNGGDGIDVATPNDYKWQFFPKMGDSLRIKVRASNDAIIGLTSHPWATDPMYEIVIGGWSNTKSVLRKYCCRNPVKAEVQTNEILKSGDFRGFWIRWDSGNFMAGREGETSPFISWRDPEPFHVAFMGVHTGFGSSGIWQIDDISTDDVIVSNKTNEHIFKPGACSPTLTRLRQGNTCAGQTVFEENFDNLREDVWQVQQYVPIDHPELPFVSYQRSTVSVKNGYLRIAPKLQQNQPGFTYSSMFGALDLYKGCTSGDSHSCFLDASDGPSVIPPVIGGRIVSRSSFAFTYGTISVRAKFPKGDWIYPEILLESFTKKFLYGTKNSGMLKIACARGNRELSDGSTQYGNKEERLTELKNALKEFKWDVIGLSEVRREDERTVERDDNVIYHFGTAGGLYGVLYSGPVIDTKCHNSLLVTKSSNKFWGDDFHVYSVKWTPEQLILSVDGEEYGRVDADKAGLRARLPKTCAGPLQPGIAPFDDHFYITLGLAAGGHSEFPDEFFTTDNQAKPWKNQASKATLNFWRDVDSWRDTWEQPELLVDYVKVVAL